MYQNKKKKNKTSYKVATKTQQTIIKRDVHKNFKMTRRYWNHFAKKMQNKHKYSLTKKEKLQKYTI